ncbi:MAG TPA: hypothetical protein VGH80_07710 [Xanthomonadaceae bacterium]|jgi:hypothetical protein
MNANVGQPAQGFEEDAARAKIKLDLASAEKLQAEARQIRRQLSRSTIVVKTVISALVAVGSVYYGYQEIFKVEKEKFDWDLQKMKIATAEQENKSDDLKKKIGQQEKDAAALRSKLGELQHQNDDLSMKAALSQDNLVAKTEAVDANRKVLELQAKVKQAGDNDARNKGAIQLLQGQLLAAKADAASAIKKSEIAEKATKPSVNTPSPPNINGVSNCTWLADRLLPAGYAKGMHGDSAKIVESAAKDIQRLSPKGFEFLSGASQSRLNEARQDSGADAQETVIARISSLISRGLYVTDQGIRYWENGKPRLVKFDDIQISGVGLGGSDDLVLTSNDRVSFRGTSMHRSTVVFELRNILLLRSACLDK